MLMDPVDNHGPDGRRAADRPRRLTATIVASLAALALGACGGSTSKSASPADSAAALPAAQLSLVAYSTPQDAYDAITDAFHKTPEGRNITFTKSYGASGDQSRAVESGLAADVVAFSLEPDMTRLVKDGIVADDWANDQYKGMITDSVVALVTRKGNPKKITGWGDLTKPGVEVITPNPFTSGGARWNVMAAYGQVTQSGGSPDAATAYLNDLFRNVAVQDGSARQALQTFTSGKGDVMIAYENEAIFAQQKAQPIDYVVPDSTILIENPVAVTKTSKYPQQAAAFLAYLHSAPAQEIFAKNGYRPIVPGTNTGSVKFPTPANEFTIAQLGGWTDVSKRFFDPATGVMADVERKIGVTVGK
jgi:sulfate transport system substrate-binding protein